MDSVSNLLQSNESGIYSEFSVDNILQNMQDQSRREVFQHNSDVNNTTITNVDVDSFEHEVSLEEKAEKVFTEGSVPVEIQLYDANLWNSFHTLTNEMILTKGGRRMFPVLKIKLNGLDPDGMYTVKMDFVSCDSRKWKFIDGKWTQCSKCEATQTSFSYTHPDSPNFGSHWMKSPISFSKIKLSNRDTNNNQVVTLQSLHKYIPRIHVTQINGNEEKRSILVHSFEQTEFITVTAYQNDQITSLKIRHNPFAKGFLDSKTSERKRSHSNNSGVTMTTQINTHNNECFNKEDKYGIYPTIRFDHNSLSHMQQKFSPYQFYTYNDDNYDTFPLVHQQYLTSDFLTDMPSYIYRSYRTSPYVTPIRKVTDYEQPIVLPDRMTSSSIPYNMNAMQYHM